MTTRKIKELVKEYSRVMGYSSNSENALYVELLENYVDDRDYFNAQVEEMKEEMVEA